jgi:hypothetical protein
VLYIFIFLNMIKEALIRGQGAGGQGVKTVKKMILLRGEKMKLPCPLPPD